MIATIIIATLATIAFLTTIAVLSFILWGGVRYYETGITQQQGTQTIILAAVLIAIQVFVFISHLILLFN